MSKKEDNIKVLIEKARGGDVKELPSLTRAFGRWLRSSFAEGPSQSSTRRLIEKFLQNLNKIVRQIEKTQNADTKTRAVQMLSRLMETIYSTGDTGTAIKYIKRISLDIERIHEDKAASKSLGDIINLLAELPQQIAVESPPANNRKSSPTRKKRAGCNGASGGGGGGGGKGGGKGGVNGGGNGGGDGDGNGDDNDDNGNGPEECGEKHKRCPRPGRNSYCGNPLLHTGKHKCKSCGIEFNGTTVHIPKKKEKKTKKKRKKKPVIFRAHWQRYTKPGLSTKLMVFLYSGSRGEKKVITELSKRTKQLQKPDWDIAGPKYLKDGTRVLIKPEMPGFRFNPRESTVEWYKDFVPAEFNMMSELKGRLPKLGKKVHGIVSFFVGPLQIAEININVIIKRQLSEDEEPAEGEKASSVYRKIFPSYSHKDLEIVEKMEEAFEAFGDEYMRDLKKLRCGQKWKPAILNFIREADVFHLYWSKASKESPYVEMEWREALKREEDEFIRPVFWKKPLKKIAPPPELKETHFNYMKF